MTGFDDCLGQACNLLSIGVTEDGGAGARIDGASGVGESGAGLSVAGGVATARFHLAVGQHVGADDQIGTAAHALAEAVEVVGVASASAEQKFLTLLSGSVVVPAQETGTAQTRFLGQFAHAHWFLAVVLALF